MVTWVAEVNAWSKGGDGQHPLAERGVVNDQLEQCGVDLALLDTLNSASIVSKKCKQAVAYHDEHTEDQVRSRVAQTHAQTHAHPSTHPLALVHCQYLCPRCAAPRSPYPLLTAAVPAR